MLLCHACCWAIAGAVTGPSAGRCQPGVGVGDIAVADLFGELAELLRHRRRIGDGASRNAGGEGGQIDDAGGSAHGAGYCTVCRSCVHIDWTAVMTCAFAPYEFCSTIICDISASMLTAVFAAKVPRSVVWTACAAVNWL